MTLESATSGLRRRIRGFRLSPSVFARAGWVGDGAVLFALTVAAVALHADVLRSDVMSGDALVHQYWMWHFRDAQLFTDGLTAELRESSRYPLLYQGLFWLPSQAVSPIVFGEWVGVVLMIASGWLIFAIVRDQALWRAAPWLAAGLFVGLADIHRFAGGFPRAFLQPVVLLTVFLAMRRRDVPAALVAGGSALIYPPASLLAVGILMGSAVGGTARRPRLDGRRVAAWLLAFALAIVAVLGSRVWTGDAPRVFTAAEAQTFQEFGPRGPLDFFRDSTVKYLRQNRSGFDLRAAGSIIVLATVAILLFRPASLKLLRAEVRVMPIVALAGYAAAQALLFRLYLPHRYTYPLVAFCVIAVAVTLHPTWTSHWPPPRRRWRAFALLSAPLVLAGVAVYAFPLGPVRPLAGLASPATAVAAGGAVLLAAAAALWLARMPLQRAAGAGAALTALVLVGAMLGNSERLERGKRCAAKPVTRHLATLPKTAIVAGDPLDLNCIPVTTRRAVVISRKLAWSYEVDYFLDARARMFATLRAYYGPSDAAIVELRRRYGATHLWVRRTRLRRVVARDGRSGGGPRPYKSFVRTLVRTGQPATLSLPGACRTWDNGRNAVYAIDCIENARQD